MSVNAKFRGCYVGAMASEHAPRVVALTPEETYPLRHRVLRPHQTLADCAFPMDAVPRAFHAGVRLAAGSLVAIGSIVPEADVSGRFPFGDWRLRGMAVHPDHRGARHGRRVLDALVAHARDGGGAAPWCNARERALTFYERAGFRRYGERFDLPAIGPHFVMGRVLPPRPKAPVLRTPRLTLVPLERGHAELTFAALNDPALFRLQEGSPKPRQAHEAATARMARGISPRDDATWLNWLVLDGATDAPSEASLAGTCQLTLPDGDLPTLGYLVVRDRWGRGYAREAATAALRFAAETLGAPAIEASHDVRNAPSQRVLEALGFRFVAMRPDPDDPSGQAMERRYVLDAAGLRALVRA